MVTPEAQRYLADRLAAVRDHRMGPAGSDAISSTLASIGGALEAFRVAGALSDEEFTDWMERAMQAAGIERRVTPPSARNNPVTAAIAESTTVRSVRLPGSPGSPPVAGPEPPGQFRKLLPGRDEEVDFFGGRLRIVGIELYERGCYVLWRMAPLPDLALALPEESAALERDTEGLPESERQHVRLRHRGLFQLASRFRVTDDVGTQYRTCGGSSSGNSDELAGRLRLAPAPPEHARVVTVDALGYTLGVDVADAS